MAAQKTRLEPVVVVSPLKVLCLFLNCSSCLCFFISILSSFWLDSVDYRSGLWLECEASKSRCSFTDETWIQVCAIMMVISLISSVCGVIFISLGFNQKESQELRFKYYKMASFAYFIGIILSIISLILFPTMFTRELEGSGRDVWYFGWSYGVAWSATLFLFAGSIILIYDRNKEEIYYREKIYLAENTA